MRKFNRKLLSFLVGAAVFTGNMQPLTVFAATDEEMTIEAQSSFVDGMYVYRDILGTGVYGIELIYGPDYGASVPVFDGLYDVDLTSLPAFHNGNVNEDATEFLVEGYLNTDPYKGVSFDPEMVWAKDWDETVDVIDLATLGFYKVTYVFRDNDGVETGRESVVISILDHDAPEIFFHQDGEGNPLPAYALYGDEVTEEILISQWGLEVIDNRLGVMSLEGLIDLSSLDRDENGLLEAKTHSLTIPSEGYIDDYTNQFPLDNVNFSVITMYLHVMEPVTDSGPVINGNNVQIYVNKDVYENPVLMHNIQAFDNEGGDITNRVTLLTDYKKLLAIDENNLAQNIGFFPLEFEVSDFEGNTASTTVMVQVLGEPQITAEEVIVHVEGEYSFDMHNPVAMGIMGEEVEYRVVGNIVPEGVVKNVPGLYNITFEADAMEGEVVSHTTTVRVVNDAPEVLAANVELETGEIYLHEMHNTLISDTEETRDKLTLTINGPIENGTLLTDEHVGEHIVTFTVKDSYGKEDTTTATVIVSEKEIIPPELNLKPIEIYVGDEYDPQEHIVSAKDGLGNDITEEVKSVTLPVEKGIAGKEDVGTHIVSFEVTDDEGLTTKEETTLIVYGNPDEEPVTPEEPEEENTPPVITGIGISMYTNEVWNIHKHSVKASDAEDGELRFEIVSHNIPLGVDNKPLEAGVYTVTVRAEDSKGLETRRTLEVIVLEEYTPESEDGIDGTDGGTENTTGESFEQEEIHQYGSLIDIDTMILISAVLMIAGLSLMVNRKENPLNRRR